MNLNNNNNSYNNANDIDFNLLENGFENNKQLIKVMIIHMN